MVLNISARYIYNLFLLCSTHMVWFDLPPMVPLSFVFDIQDASVVRFIDFYVKKLK